MLKILDLHNLKYLCER